MIRHYAELTEAQIARAGEAWLECDVSTCDAEARVDVGELPEGWATDNPDGDPLEGAAQFCPAHASRSPRSPQPEPEPE